MKKVILKIYFTYKSFISLILILLNFLYTYYSAVSKTTFIHDLSEWMLHIYHYFSLLNLKFFLQWE